MCRCRQKGGKIIDSMTHFIHTFIDTHVYIYFFKVHIVSEDCVERESNRQIHTLTYNKWFNGQGEHHSKVTAAQNEA